MVSAVSKMDDAAYCSELEAPEQGIQQTDRRVLGDLCSFLECGLPSFLQCGLEVSAHGAHHSSLRRRVVSQLAPRHPGPGEGFRGQVLSQRPVPDHRQHHPQTVIPAGRIEAGEIWPRTLHAL